MATLDLNNINIDTFCDLNGVDDLNRILMNKLYKDEIHSYTEWHELLSKNFKLHPKKDFTPKIDKAETEEVSNEIKTEQPLMVVEENEAEDITEVDAPAETISKTAIKKTNPTSNTK